MLPSASFAHKYSRSGREFCFRTRSGNPGGLQTDMWQQYVGFASWGCGLSALVLVGAQQCRLDPLFEASLTRILVCFWSSGVQALQGTLGL